MPTITHVFSLPGQLPGIPESPSTSAGVSVTPISFPKRDDIKEAFVASQPRRDESKLSLSTERKVSTLPAQQSLLRFTTSASVLGITLAPKPEVVSATPQAIAPVMTPQLIAKAIKDRNTEDDDSEIVAMIKLLPDSAETVAAMENLELLHKAIDHVCLFDVIKALIQKGLSVNAEGGSYKTIPLLYILNFLASNDFIAELESAEFKDMMSYVTEITSLLILNGSNRVDSKHQVEVKNPQQKTVNYRSYDELRSVLWPKFQRLIEACDQEFITMKPSTSCKSCVIL